MFKKIFGFGKNKSKVDEKIKTEDENLKIKELEELKLKEMAEKKELEKLKIKEEEELKKKEEDEKKELERLKKEKLEKEIERKKIEDLEKKESTSKKRGFFKSLKEKLEKTREGLFGKMKKLFSSRSIIDEEMYEELEDLLIQSDIGMDMTLKIVKELEKEVKKRGIKDPNLVYDVLKDVMEGFLISEGTELKVDKPGMNIILVVGVNGVGKTTTIGKLAAKFVKNGKKVVIGAGDTFRAAAIEQLEEWANRAGADIIKHEQGSDPGAVVFDTLKAGKNRNADIVIIDTAGRLHNKNNLMKELEKINIIIKKHVGDTNYESLLVIDGTTGQNGLNQAKVFNEVTKLSGFVVTKLDGTAKGGIVFAISEELKKPIKFIGVGEGIEDLREFKSKEYIEAIFE
ncbi:MAG TPA: signal recognition particle-docking protein FtsY [Fusobacteriaceae bacterium]|nr:signal recognition particle-docking protein FtsY [Fusobacteriaceae bacterium]